MIFMQNILWNVKEFIHHEWCYGDLNENNSIFECNTVKEYCTPVKRRLWWSYDAIKKTWFSLRKVYLVRVVRHEEREIQLRYFTLETHINNDMKTHTETEERVCGHVPSPVQY